MRLALEGVRVLDMAWVGPGPFCATILGDLGAEIIKIHEP
jgi:alpha-methylacyl-CoA racemase